MKTFNVSLFLVAWLVSVISCNSSGSNVVRCAIFFNPSQAFYSNEIHFKAKLNDSLILDSIIKNKRVDNSELLTCLSFDNPNKHVLSIEVDGIEQLISLNSETNKCLNVFVKIDDHSLLDLEQDKIQRKMLAIKKKVVMKY
jgi:hypothetical protein